MRRRQLVVAVLAVVGMGVLVFSIKLVIQSAEPQFAKVPASEPRLWRDDHEPLLHFRRDRVDSPEVRPGRNPRNHRTA